MDKTNEIVLFETKDKDSILINDNAEEEDKT